MAKNKRLELIYQNIRSKILTDEYRAGKKLSEIQLSKEYDCSRTPIREILQRLEHDGLILIKPKSGTYVKNETTKDFVELMQVRAALERQAFSLAVTNLGLKEFNRLEKLKKEMDLLVEKEPIDMMKYAKIHYQFHLQLVLGSQNGLLIQFFERLNLRSSHMFYTSMDKNLGIHSQKEHQMIIDYIKNRDPEGPAFIQSHLEKKIERYTGKVS